MTPAKPASIDTPLFQKAKCYLGVEPQPISPVYVPEVVAEAILTAATRSVRELITGGAAVPLPIAEAVAPGLTDRYMERNMFDSQKTDRPVGDRPDNLYAPVADDGGERGRNWTGDTKSSSAPVAGDEHGTGELASLRGGREPRAERGHEGRVARRGQPCRRDARLGRGPCACGNEQSEQRDPRLRQHSPGKFVDPMERVGEGTPVEFRDIAR